MAPADYFMQAVLPQLPTSLFNLLLSSVIYRAHCYSTLPNYYLIITLPNYLDFDHFPNPNKEVLIPA